MARALNESQFLVTIQGYGSPIYFQGKTGGEKSAGTSTYNDGLHRANRKVVGNFEVSDVTLTRAYEPEVDPNFMRFLDDYCNAEDGDLTITIQPVDKCATANPIGAALTYIGCQFIGYSIPDVARDSDGMAVMSYNFAADDLVIDG